MWGQKFVRAFFEFIDHFNTTETWVWSKYLNRWGPASTVISLWFEVFLISVIEFLHLRSEKSLNLNYLSVFRKGLFLLKTPFPLKRPRGALRGTSYWLCGPPVSGHKAKENFSTFLVVCLQFFSHFKHPQPDENPTLTSMLLQMMYRKHLQSCNDAHIWLKSAPDAYYWPNQWKDVHWCCQFVLFLIFFPVKNHHFKIFRGAGPPGPPPQIRHCPPPYVQKSSYLFKQWYDWGKMQEK